MVAYYHETEERLRELLSGGQVLMGITQANNMVVVMPFDVVYWSEETDRIFTELATFADRRGFKGRQVLLTGMLTPAARRQLGQKGFTSKERYLFRTR